MLFSFSARVMLAVLLVFGMSNLCFAEPIVLKSSPVNSVQIKALQLRQAKVFEVQLGGGSNQPAANTWISGKASMVSGEKRYSGYYRISTDPARQLRMTIKTANKDSDEYKFVTGYDTLHFEFAPTSSFTNPWLIGQITNVSATQRVPQSGGQNNGGQNNGGQNGQSDGAQNNGNEHPPISFMGKMSARTGGSLAKYFRSGDSTLLLNVGGNQRLSVLTPGNTLSGMSLKQGSYYEPIRR